MYRQIQCLSINLSENNSKMSKILYCLIGLWLVFSSCLNSIKPENLYGKWVYVKVENINHGEADTLLSVRAKMWIESTSLSPIQN